MLQCANASKYQPLQPLPITPGPPSSPRPNHQGPDSVAQVEPLSARLPLPPSSVPRGLLCFVWRCRLRNQNVFFLAMFSTVAVSVASVRFSSNPCSTAVYCCPFPGFSHFKAHSEHLEPMPWLKFTVKRCKTCTRTCGAELSMQTQPDDIKLKKISGTNPEAVASNSYLARVRKLAKQLVSHMAYDALVRPAQRQV